MRVPPASHAQITLRLPPLVRAELERRASLERMGLSLYVRRLLWAHVEPNPPEPAASAAQPAGAREEVA